MATRASSFFQPPEVSQAEIDSFWEAHFSDFATQSFHQDFLNPEANASQVDQDQVYYEDYEDEDDGLGYYADGVKRTLTNEQIAIFRHSEIETLRRAHAKRAKGDTESAVAVENTAGSGSEDGELEEPEDVKPTKAKSKKKKRNKKKAVTYEPKPDLRKRTWDVVEAGMDSLDYDELDSAGRQEQTPATQRRKISYED